jgi:hypothetical protein
MYLTTELHGVFQSVTKSRNSKINQNKSCETFSKKIHRVAQR